MKGNLRFVIMPAEAGYRLICQYRNEEIAWGPFATLAEVFTRIGQALERLEEQTKIKIKLKK